MITCKWCKTAFCVAPTIYIVINESWKFFCRRKNRCGKGDAPFGAFYFASTMEEKMVFHFYKGKDHLKFDIPNIQEMGQYENSLICTGKVEGAAISVKLDYAVPPRKLSESLKPFRRMGLSGFYQIIETNKTSLYTEYIAI